MLFCMWTNKKKKFKKNLKKTKKNGAIHYLPLKWLEGPLLTDTERTISPVKEFKIETGLYSAKCNLWLEYFLFSFFRKKKIPNYFHLQTPQVHLFWTTRDLFWYKDLMISKVHTDSNNAFSGFGLWAKPMLEQWVLEFDLRGPCPGCAWKLKATHAVKTNLEGDTRHEN